MNDDRRFEAHPGRGRFNATFSAVMDGYINWHLKQQKTRAYKDLPETVVELGPRPGANLRYLRPGNQAHRDRARPVHAGSLAPGGGEEGH
jgi:hypothetical protein